MVFFHLHVSFFLQPENSYKGSTSAEPQIPMTYLILGSMSGV